MSRLIALLPHMIYGLGNRSRRQFVVKSESPAGSMAATPNVTPVAPQGALSFMGPAAVNLSHETTTHQCVRLAIHL